MGRCQGIGCLNTQIEKCGGRDWALADSFFQVLPFQQLHNDRWPSILFLHFINGADAWMVQRGGSLGLALKPLEGFWVARQRNRKKFQSNTSPQANIFRFENHPHAATAQILDNAVVRDGLADDWQD